MRDDTPRQNASLKGYTEAMRDALAEEMRRDASVITLGEGIGPRGGNWGETAGLYDEFGPERVMDMPISELGFTGMGVGAALRGLRPVVNLMFVDFFGEAFSQIVNQAAKWHYLSGGQASVPVVFWGVMGAGSAAGGHHSGCLYPLFMHIAGLKVAVPATPADGKGLLKTAIRDDNPVVFLAHRMLWDLRGPVPEGELIIPFGKARIVRDGTDVTVVAIARMVHEAEQAADALAEQGISVEVLDPRTLVPLDVEAILASVEKTGRLVIVDEAYSRCSAAAEISALVAQEGFEWLRAPIRRVETLPVPHPVSPPLEAEMLPNAGKVVDAVHKAMQDDCGRRTQEGATHE